MPAVTTMKCSARRTALRRVQQLVNNLIEINEAADQVRTEMLAAGYDASEIGNTVNAILAAAGPATTATTAATGDKTTDRLINALNANTSETTIQIGWLYLAE